VKFGIDAQEAHEIDGSKCLGVIATTAAMKGYLDLARRIAQKITQPARRENALQKIEEISSRG